VADGERRDVDVDPVGDVGRVGRDLELARDLLEEAALVAHALGNADERERDAHRDPLAGDQLLEVDVDERAAHRVALDLADERAHRGAAERELEHRRGGDALEREAEGAGVERQPLRLAAVAVDDGGDAPGRAELARGALAGLAARLGGEGGGGHVRCNP
jgi:hypothetical protein